MKTTDVFSLFSVISPAFLGLSLLILGSSTSFLRVSVASSLEVGPRPEWADLLQEDQWLALTEDLPLETASNDPRTPLLLKKGTRFHLDSVDGLDMIRVTLLTLTEENCTPQSVPDTEITLILPEGTSADSHSEVGVQLTQNCTLSVFIEWKDLYRSSFFSKLSVF